MASIVLPGNHTIHLSCPVFTELREDSDENTFYCEYEEWAYGLFAILLILTVLVPISLFVYCLVKSYNQRAGYRRMQRQISASSYDSQFYGSHDTSYEILSGRSNHKSINPAMAKKARDMLTSKVDGERMSKIMKNRAGSRQLSCSAPLLSSNVHHRYGGDGQTSNHNRGLFNDACSTSKDFKPCSFCNDDSKMLGIYCEDCSQEKENGGGSNDVPSRCCSDSCVNTCQAIGPSASSKNDLEKTTSNHLYPKLDDIATKDSSMSSLLEIYPNSLPKAGPSKEMLGEREKYDSYFLQRVESAMEGERNGYFLIRDSLSRSNCKVLMLYHSDEDEDEVSDSHVLRYRICPHDDDSVGLEGSRASFPDISSLLMFYRTNQVQLPCRLTIMV